MKKQLVNLLILGIIALTCSAYDGYAGSLPQLGADESSANLEQEEIKEVKPEIAIPNLAPKNYPDIYAGVLAKQGKYSKYLEDLDAIIPVIEGMKDVIATRSADSMQMFSAKANLISLYVNSLEKKYENKPERNYESYKQLVKLNKLLNDVVYTWKNSVRYQRISHGGLKSKLANDRLINEKLDNALKSINLTLQIIREN